VVTRGSCPAPPYRDALRAAQHTTEHRREVFAAAIGPVFLDRGKGKGGGSCDAEDVSAPMHPQPMHPRATTHTHTHPRTCARANFLGFCTNPAWPLPPGARV
jgi:hypothetical protein